MGRGKRLTEAEISQIDILQKDGKTPYQISKLLHRSVCVCNNYIKKKGNYGKNHNGAKKTIG